jgi:beta-phosphoglucomutase-like phosphatase (HAD superfamily)
MWIELVVFELEAIADVGDRLPREVFGMSVALRRLVVADVRIGIVTALPRHAAHHTLRTLGWMEIVDVCVTTDDARGAPPPDMVDQAIRTLGVASAGRVASVSSTPFGLTLGASAGCAIVIGISGRGCDADVLREGPCTQVMPTAALVPDLLRRVEGRPELAAGWDG